MKPILKLCKPYLLTFIALIIFTYITVMTILRLPDYSANIVNKGIILQNLNSIWADGRMMIIVALIGGVSMIINVFLASRIATGLARDIREKVFTQLENSSIADFNKFSTASLITRSTNDIQQIQTALTILLRFALMAPLIAIVGIQKALKNAPNLTWIIASAVISLLIIIAILFTIAIPKFKKLQKLVDKLNLVTRENLTGLKVIRAFHNEKIEQAKFQRVNNELNRFNLSVNHLMMLLDPIMMLTMNLTSVAVVWFGAKLIDINGLEIGNMMAFLQYAMQIIISFLMISMVFIMVPRATVSLQRVNEILNMKPSIINPKEPKHFPSNGKGKIEFRDVTFSYPDANLPVLSGINFTAEPGQTTAFIGSTGSGKSTLINLIPRFYDVSAGQILIDDIDIREVSSNELMSRIGYIPQKGVLFSGTITSNIAYGNPKASSKQIEEAAKIAQAAEFINELDKKYSNNVSQGGKNVSGGQRQRLSIARALATDAKIYIFDDSFSALDFKTDARLRQALTKKTKNKTVLIVAQRINTIMNADKIIVLNEGKIVGQGTHAELMRSCSIYREIASSQLSDEELSDLEKAPSKNRKGRNNE